MGQVYHITGKDHISNQNGLSSEDLFSSASVTELYELQITNIKIMMMYDDVHISAIPHYQVSHINGFIGNEENV